MRGVLIGICVFVLLCTVVMCVGYAASQTVEEEEYSFADGSPVRIAVVGDLHYPESFLSLGKTASLLETSAPDVVLFVGDIFDASAEKGDVEALGEFFTRLCKRFLCFAVIGNHEIGSDHLDDYVRIASDAGVCVLLNDCATQKVNGREIAFIGLTDGYPYEENTLASLPRGATRVLLTHRPEKLDEYADAPSSIRPDYVFAGHAHGGVARLGTLALYAPDQGFFPSYTSGLYEKNDVRMVVTRGLGVGSMDFRCFNKYHLPVVSI